MTKADGLMYMVLGAGIFYAIEMAIRTIIKKRKGHDDESDYIDWGT